MRPEDGAAQALDDFANGPALEAAEDTARAFELAGDRIAKALERAAKLGELSFSGLAERVTQDLARIAINELFSAVTAPKIQGNSPTSTTINMTVNGVTDAPSFQRSTGQVSAMLARAVADGQRYL